MTGRVVCGRVYLRPAGSADVSELWVEALSDPVVVRWTEARHSRWDAELVRAYAEADAASDETELLGIFLADEDRHIGNVRLSGLDRRHRRVELGILLFDKASWGHGFGTDALNAACDWAFSRMNVHKVCADYYAVNAASARMFEKAGFVHQGVFVDHFLTSEGWVDSVRVAHFEPKGDDS